MVEEIPDFVREHWTPSLAWEEGRLEEWLAWFERDRRLARAKHGDRLVGIGLGRRVHFEQLGMTDKHRYTHTEDGEVIYVDLVATSDPRAMSALWECMLKRLGEGAEWVAFRRGRHSGRMTVWPLARATRFFLRHLGPVASTKTHAPSLLEV